jgi:hypothetical protein
MKGLSHQFEFGLRCFLQVERADLGEKPMIFVKIPLSLFLFLININGKIVLGVN